jgi:hypothetical protein
MTIKHKCNCGAEAEFSGDELCHGNIFEDATVICEYHYQVEWLAARWLQLHDNCRQLGLRVGLGLISKEERKEERGRVTP